MLANPGLYIHLPWCVKKCPYCDFNSHPLKDDSRFDTYIDAVIRDLTKQLETQPDCVFDSVFIGGGTPSLCPPEQLYRLLSKVPRAADAEVTMEANPGTSEFFDWGEYLGAGVNRLSIGAQSFNREALNVLGRIHGPDEIIQAFSTAQAGGFQRINLDLMWGLPGQDTDQAIADLLQAIALAPDHISWYQLTIEAKTEFAKRPPVLPVENELSSIEAAGLKVLADAGYERYEVSAYARDPSDQCRHNLNYWQFGDYLGAGAGAHGKITNHTANSLNLTRTSKPGSPRAYQNDPLITYQADIASQAQPGEFMLNALRLVNGVDWALFEQRTASSPAMLSQTWSRLVELGLVMPDRCATTDLGLRYLDSVVAEFV